MRRVSSKGKMPTPKSLRSHEMPQPRHLAEEDVALQRGLQVGLQKNLGVSRPALLPAQPLRCAQSVPRPWLPADATVSNSGTAWKQIQKKIPRQRLPAKLNYNERALGPVSNCAIRVPMLV